MKKILFTLVLFFFAATCFAQIKTSTVLTDTISNSQSKTGYITDLFSYNNTDKYYEITDSITLNVAATGEIDLDKLIVTKGRYINSTFYATGTPDTTTLTIDNAAAAITVVKATATSTGLNSLAGVDAIRIVIIAGAAGNDASDPNQVRIYADKRFQRKNSVGL